MWFRVLALAAAFAFSAGASQAAAPTVASKAATASDGFVAGLIDQHGAPVKAQRLVGKPSIVHFGFTHCPEVCPTTLNAVAGLMQQLGELADQINFVFVTVDPERDTADVLKQYIAHFDNRIIALTGSTEAIAAVARAFKTSFAKRPNKDGSGYSMDHAIFAFLKDRNWKTVSTLYLGSGANRELVKKRLKGLLSKTGS